MSFNAALSAGQKTKIRSANYAGDLQITLCSNTVIFAAQLNTDLSAVTSWASFAYNNVTVGAYTDIEVGQVIIVSDTNDVTKGRFRGRIRKAATNTTIYTNESSTDFAVGAYLFVVDTYDPTYILSRPSTSDPATAVELVDYDVSYAAPRASVVGLRTAYVGRVDPATNKMRVVFDVSNSFAVASGDNVSSYAFTFKASTYTLASGSLSGATPTVDFNADTEQWGKLTATTANGQVKTRRFYVRAYGTNSQPDTGADETSIQISGDLQRGWTMSCSYFTGVDSVLNRTFAVAWRENENYGGVAGGLDSNNIAFVGWLQTEDDDLTGDPTFSVLSTARFNFTGVGPRMQRLRAQEVAIRLNSSPTEWGDLVNATPWRAIAHFLDRYSTITNLCDLNFDDKTNAYLFPDFSTTGGNLYAAVQSIAQQIAANIEFAPDGRIEVNVSAEYLTNLGRAGLVTVLDLQAQDCFNIQRSMDPDGSIGVVDGVGASYNSSSGQVSVYSALAPGHAQGEAAGAESLQAPILVATPYASAALVDLRQRAGNRYEVANNSEVLEMDHPDGFTFPIPSRYQLYTLTIDATVAGPNGVSRIIYDTTTQWLLEAVSFSRPGNGATNVHCRYRKLTRIGDPGDDITQIAANQIEDQLPDLGFPAFNWEDPSLTFPDVGLDAVNPSALVPPPGSIATFKGQELLVASASGGKVYYLKSVIALKKPISVDITPSDLGSYVIQMVGVSPFKSKTAIPGYVLGYNSGSDKSAVWYNLNVAAPNARDNWTKGADADGEYKVLRATGVDGTILIYGPSATATPGSTWSHTFDFTVSDWGWQVAIGTGGALRAAYVPGQGWHKYAFNPGGAYLDRVTFFKTFSSHTITFERATVDSCTGISSIGMWGSATLSPSCSGGEAHYPASPGATGTFTTEGIDVVMNPANDPYVQSVYFEGTGTNPFGGVGDAFVSKSADNGATWAAAVDVGANPGSVGGFDVQAAGSVSYAAIAGAVYKATTLGGSYSPWYTVPSSGNPVCIIIPYFRRNSTTRNTAVSDPDVVVVTDSGKIYWVDGTAATATDITPATTLPASNPDCLTVRYGNEIAVWGQAGGGYKVYTSVDGGGSYTDRGSISSPGKIRCRREDDSKSPNGQIYLAQADAIDFSSKWFSNALYPRTMPTTGVLLFDTIF